MLPENEPLLNTEEETEYSLSSLEGMDPNSTLPPVGYRDAFPEETDPEQTTLQSKPNHSLRIFVTILFILSLIGFAGYGLVLAQRSMELNSLRAELKTNLGKLATGLESVDTALTSLQMTGNSRELTLAQRLTRQEKLSYTGKTEAIRATQTLSAIKTILNNPSISGLTPPSSSAFDQVKSLTLSGESFTDEAYKTFAYLARTYAADASLATLSLNLAEVINNGLVNSDTDPNQLKETQTALEKTKTTLAEAGKDLPFALNTVAEKNLALLDGFAAAVTATKLALITQDRLALTTLVNETGAKLNTLWQSRRADENAFWTSNRTLKRYLYLKTDLAKLLQLL
ncbi:MAG: hypothetical protein AAB486_02725 [Patescibacteria group bacterium]